MTTYSNILKYIDSTTYLKPHKELICKHITNTYITRHYGMYENEHGVPQDFKYPEYVPKNYDEYIIYFNMQTKVCITCFGSICEMCGASHTGNLIVGLPNKQRFKNSRGDLKTRLCDGVISIICEMNISSNVQETMNELYILDDLMMKYHNIKNNYDIVELYDSVKQLQQENLVYKKIIESLCARVDKLETLNCHQTMAFL